MNESNYESQESDLNYYINPADIDNSENAGFGADISKLFLEDEFADSAISEKTKTYFDAIKKLGVGQYTRSDEDEILNRVSLMKVNHIMAGMACDFTWEDEVSFSILNVLTRKNLSMGRDATFMKHAFGSINETSVVQTLNAQNDQRKSGMIASLFNRKR